MFKSTIQVTLFSILGIAINFVTQLLLAYYFGTTQDRDAYFAALTIPTYITTLFIGSIGMMFLPYLVKYQTVDNPDRMVGFTAPVINTCFLILSGVVLVGCLWGDIILQLIVPASKGTILATAIYLFRIQLISVLFTVLGNLLAVVFQARHAFLSAALSPIITSFTTMLFVGIFSPALGIKSIVYGTLLGSILSFLFIFLLVFKQFQYRWSFSFQQPGLKGLFMASLPLFGAGILFRSTTVFERFFAARLPEGSLSYLGSGNQIIVILSTIIASGIATTSFPLLSKYWSDNDLLSLQKTLMKVINLIVLIVFPMIVVFIASGTDIIRILFEHGAFRGQDTVALYHTLLGLMGYFLFSSIGNLTARVLYISQNTWMLALIASAELLIYVISALILTKSYQFIGLAVSMSLGAGFNIIVSFIFINKKLLNLDMRNLIARTGVIFVFSAFVLLLLFLLNKYWLIHADSLVKCLVTVFSAGIFYWLLLPKMIKNNEYNSLIELIKK